MLQQQNESNCGLPNVFPNAGRYCFYPSEWGVCNTIAFISFEDYFQTVKHWELTSDAPVKMGFFLFSSVKQQILYGRPSAVAFRKIAPHFTKQISFATQTISTANQWVLPTYNHGFGGIPLYIAWGCRPVILNWLGNDSCCISYCIAFAISVLCSKSFGCQESIWSQLQIFLYLFF